MNSLIVKDSGIHVSDGEVEIICQDQNQARQIIYDNGFNLFYNQPYPIPGLRFEVKRVNRHARRDDEPTTVDVAILSIEESRSNGFRLKNPSELVKMTTEETYSYIDRLHSLLRDYQIVIDQAISKNQNINSHP